MFWGLYATHYFNAPRTTGLDLYYLGIHNDHATYVSGTACEDRHSLGAREFWGVEALGLGCGASPSSRQLWKRFHPCMDRRDQRGIHLGGLWSAQTWIKAGIVSGDHDPNYGHLETFNAPVLQIRLLQRCQPDSPANIIGFHPNLTL